MKFNKVLPFALMCLGFSLTGCGNNNSNEENTTMVETTTNSSISNDINSVFDGYRYNTDDYNTEYTTYDKNYSNGYKRSTTSTNDRFGDGMKGAQNIKGNENKTTSQKISSDINNMYNDTKNTYDNIKNSIMD